MQGLEPRLKDKEWNHKEERDIFDAWYREGIYSFDTNSKKLFVIDTPPPYPSGRPWHAGAVVHYTQIDMIARTARMLGYSTLFPLGIDRNGLPVEIYTERKYKVRMKEIKREKFLELCRIALDDLEQEMIDIMKKAGLSGDYQNYYRTDSEEYRTLTQQTFIKLWKKRLIYEATRPNNYCDVCGTTIADAEVIYESLPAKLVYIKFKVKERDEITVATTRPELLCSCQAILVNPEDERYISYHHRMAIIPIYNREVPIIPHSSAKPEFGTGVVMVCSYGDYTDVLLFRELGLKEIIAINEEGKLTEVSGKYKGLKVREAREKIIQDLIEENLVVKVESIEHRTPICERSKNPIEIIPMREYYLKQLEFLPKLKKIAEKIIFHPENHRQILINWLNSITLDWAISRRRYYGTEIPIWYCKDCKEPHLPEEGKYYQPWKDKAPFERCKRCGSKEFVGEDKTFDTWMDSSITPLYITKYMKDFNFFKKSYPIQLRPQAKDIVRTWLYYTILRCYQLTGKAPFKHAWIMGYGLDERGERMSKSKGNVIDPLPLIEKFGADTFRFWGAAETNLGYDFQVSESRIAGTRKFINKLWNVARFISQFPFPERARLTPTDRWILAELSKLIAEAKEGYEAFNFFIPANKLREFIWNIFASHYVEMIKARAYGSDKKDREAAWFTLHTCLRALLLLLAPITPFITEKIWREIYSKESIHKQRFPRAKWSKKYCAYTKKIIEFNSKVWNLKKERGLSLRDAISVEIDRDLEIFKKDLINMHNIKF
ncbi:MAG: valine--tRNA ligase [Nitrososphaerales archaeon]